jgi:hypothetical protein
MLRATSSARLAARNLAMPRHLDRKTCGGQGKFERILCKAAWNNANLSEP